MKKLFLLCLLAVLCVGIKAQDSVEIKNVLTVEVQPTTQIKRVPVLLSLENTLDITAMQCYIHVSDTLARFCKTDDDNKSFVCGKTSRWTDTHQVMFAWVNKDAKKFANSLMAILVSPKSENLIGHEGPILKVYLDCSDLKDGTYSVSIKGGNVAWTNANDVKAYYSPETEATFVVRNGEVVAESAE